MSGQATTWAELRHYLAECGEDVTGSRPALLRAAEDRLASPLGGETANDRAYLASLLAAAQEARDAR